jgi:hypothetical protein
MQASSDIVKCGGCGKSNRVPLVQAGVKIQCGACHEPLVLVTETASRAAMNPGARLEMVLGNLRVSVRAMDADVRQVEMRFATEPQRLLAVVRAIEPAKPHPPRDPERFVAEWVRRLRDSSASVSRRAIANLCWVSDVALDPRFHAYLDQSGAELSPRSIKGLVGCHHRSWSESQSMNDLAWSLRQRVGRLPGRSGALERWAREPARVFGPQAPEKFAEEIVKLGPGPASKSWEIDEGSEFFTRAMLHAGIGARRRMQVPEVSEIYFGSILPWEGWGARSAAFKSEISAAILDPTVDAIGARDRMQSAVVQHPLLGDPRLQPDHWRLRASDEAKNRVLQHLSQADITFFFDHMLPDGQDPHGRKKFWLAYAKHVRMSRPLLSPVDRVRLERSLGVLPKHCGVLRGSNSNSAFLLMFDGLLAVEFSRVGRIYFFRDYIQRVVPDFWTDDVFDERVLKDQTHNAESFAHLPPRGWEGNVRAFLRTYGITDATWR